MRLTLENALRAKQLDRTLTDWRDQPADARRGSAARQPDTPALARTEFPPGQLSEIVGPACSGRLTLALQAMADTTGRGELAALVDTFDRLDVASAAAAGTAFDRLLWVRGQPVSRTDAGTGLRDRVVERALKALMLILQAGGFSLVVLDLAEVPMPALRRLPPATWLRVQRAVEGRDTACVLLTAEPLARSAGGLMLALRAHPVWHGDAARSRFLQGLAVEGRITSPRRRLDAALACRAELHGDEPPLAGGGGGLSSW